MTPDEQTVDRYSVEPWDIRRADMKRDPEGEYVRYDDYRAAISAMPDTTQQSSGDDGNREPLMWAVEKWRDEVQNRPLHNVLRRTLDDTWRTVMRKFGGNPEELVGPSHDDLVATAAEATP